MTSTDTEQKPKRGGVFTDEMRRKGAATRAANRAAKDAAAGGLTVNKLAQVRKAGDNPKPPKVGTQLTGLTIADCAIGCNPTFCVISGKPYCAHPAKGGLQPADAGNQAALGRLNEAKRILGDRKVVV